MSKVDAQRAMRQARYAAYAASLAATGTPGASEPPGRVKHPPSGSSAAPDPRSAASADDDGQAALVTPADGMVGTTPWPVGTAHGAADPVMEPGAAAGVSGEPELCGHRNLSNKGCRRPAGHTEKNHRYK